MYDRRAGALLVVSQYYFGNLLTFFKILAVTYSRIHFKKSNNFPIGKKSKWSLPQNLGPIWIDPRKKLGQKS
jgi:hypothetical protein